MQRHCEGAKLNHVSFLSMLRSPVIVPDDQVSIYWDAVSGQKPADRRNAFAGSAILWPVTAQI
jgi:hypothetical protein